MHSKDKGTIGELSIARDLMQLGCPVFTEVGDNSKVDIITMVNEQCVRIQVKALSIDDGKITLSTRKSGPDYSFYYTQAMLDIFAVYIPDEDIVLYVAFKDLNNQTTMHIRLTEPRNGQSKGINLAQHFESFALAYEKQFDCKYPDPTPIVIKEVKPTSFPQSALDRRTWDCTAEQLTGLIHIKTISDIALQFGVTPSAIRQRCRTLKINIAQIRQSRS